MLGLYLHVPFCSAICNYCNFNRGLFDADLKRRYVDALVQEIERTAPPRSRADGRHDLLRRRHAVTPRAVRNPARHRARAAATFARHAGRRGHDRSESGDGDDGQACGRIVRRASIASASASSRFATTSCSGCRDCMARVVRGPRFGEARAAGFDNVSLDLMMWLPAQPVAPLAGIGGCGDCAGAGTRCRSTCWRSIRTRRFATRWRAPAGRRRPTRTRRRCT